MKNLDGRLERLEGKLSSDKMMMIVIKDDQTLKDAVKEFNRINGTNLKEREAKRWEEIPPPFGPLRISPNWNIDDFLDDMKNNSNRILKNFDF